MKAHFAELKLELMKLENKSVEEKTTDKESDDLNRSTLSEEFPKENAEPSSNDFANKDGEIKYTEVVYL